MLYLVSILQNIIEICKIIKNFIGFWILIIGCFSIFSLSQKKFIKMNFFETDLWEHIRSGIYSSYMK